MTAMLHLPDAVLADFSMIPMPCASFLQEQAEALRACIREAVVQLEEHVEMHKAEK